MEKETSQLRPTLEINSLQFPRILSALIDFQDFLQIPERLFVTGRVERLLFFREIHNLSARHVLQVEEERKCAENVKEVG